MSQNVDFIGDCGIPSMSSPKFALSSSKGINEGESVSIQGNTDLSRCIMGYDGACVYGIKLILNDPWSMWTFLISVKYNISPGVPTPGPCASTEMRNVHMDHGSLRINLMPYTQAPA